MIAVHCDNGNAYATDGVYEGWWQMTDPERGRFPVTTHEDLATLRNPWGLMPDVVTAAADRVETELARLREGLRPESLARLFHETYERLAPDHGYKTREESAVLWEDVPAANRALMIATADAVARALLADTAKDGQ